MIIGSSKRKYEACFTLKALKQSKKPCKITKQSSLIRISYPERGIIARSEYIPALYYSFVVKWVIIVHLYDRINIMKSQRIFQMYVGFLLCYTLVIIHIWINPFKNHSMKKNLSCDYIGFQKKTSSLKFWKSIFSKIILLQWHRWKAEDFLNWKIHFIMWHLSELIHLKRQFIVQYFRFFFLFLSLPVNTKDNLVMPMLVHQG